MDERLFKFRRIGYFSQVHVPGRTSRYAKLPPCGSRNAEDQDAEQCGRAKRVEGRAAQSLINWVGKRDESDTCDTGQKHDDVLEQRRGFADKLLPKVRKEKLEKEIDQSGDDSLAHIPTMMLLTFIVDDNLASKG